MPKKIRRKRPCRICRKWFRPDARQGDRQKTCGDPDCMREWHRRQCEKWNHSNPEYFKSNYLNKKIEQADQKKADQKKTASCSAQLTSPKQVIQKPALPNDIIVNSFGGTALIIIRYLIFQIRQIIAPQPHGETVGLL